MTDSLFRQEAINNQRERLLGDIILIQPMRNYLLTIILLLVIGLIIGFLLWGTYARKETVQGYLVPNKGVVKIYAPRAGIFEEIYVKEGETVKAGDILMAVRVEQSLVTGTDKDALILQEINDQKIALNLRINRMQQWQTTEEQRLHAQISGLEQEIAQFKRQETIQSKQLTLAKKNQQRLLQLLEDQYISEVDYQKEQANYLSQQLNSQTLFRQITTKRNTLIQARYELKQLPINSMERIEEIRSDLSELKQRQSEIRGRRAYTLKAPSDGKVVSLEVQTGQAAIPDRPLLALLPIEATLQAHLFVPTRAIGFVEIDQPVRLQYDAFPYQRFGVQQGRIEKITQTILTPRELPVPLRLEEAVYRVNVVLDKQAVSAYGKQFPLQSGMLLHADIVLEPRSLFEWLLEPFYSLKGRV